MFLYLLYISLILIFFEVLVFVLELQKFSLFVYPREMHFLLWQPQEGMQHILRLKKNRCYISYTLLLPVDFPEVVHLGIL
ncbi:hypothetical protein CUR65_10475 [Salmonella enterica subsp. enterica serovar Legon]|nr:hypothetical protein CUR58_08555 [Salmonella enterica subsp. enterica serovar Legon]PVB88683.1 hypothetical protein CUR65_10475 [Salmonella enterica subsp. enterica serovar Legon]PVB92309.1 hypothetical protein CUR66_11745 [Salmonella enterica subsp. enterica serovar Legon]PVB98558.1 hypothetical protein CUR73_14315 [Salmonella enterica subsp. enterica serovar Legon]PVC06223.1 hypothetical protein CUR74_12780 [Salmonella enterica subsp. enterica serovar Legon]